MNDQQQKLQQLLDRRDWTSEERQWLLEYVETTDTAELKELLQEQFHMEDEVMDPELVAEILDNIHGKIVYRRKWTYGLMAAAAIAGLMAISVYLVNRSPQTAAIVAAKAPVQKTAEKAVLTLADGSTIELDDAQNGTLASQGSTKVIKLNGKLSYASGGNSEAVGYNTIRTPKGKQYQVELPDGSMVWLNAASCLRFPTAFTGKERRVEVTGEAYFEIARHTTMPFFVKVKDAEVQVLGTHFNIMAYEEDEVMKTTLLQGAIRFVSASSSHLLTPGQQSQMEKNGAVKIENGVNLSEVMAWKSGSFHFEGENITCVMRQLSRWYDVDIVYQDNDIKDLFFADIPMNTGLADVLSVLQLTGKVQFKTDGRKVIVMH